MKNSCAGEILQSGQTGGSRGVFNLKDSDSAIAEPGEDYPRTGSTAPVHEPQPRPAGATVEGLAIAGEASSRDSGLMCLGLILSFYGIAANLDQLRSDIAPDGEAFAALHILTAARHLKIKARELKSNPERAECLPLPGIAETKDGRFFILARAARGQILVQFPGERPAQWSEERLSKIWSGHIILFTLRPSVQQGRAEKFDLSWFIPSIVKYRKLLGEVLLASLFLQIFGLVSPLFFQVVVDKVLLHHSLRTLDVVMIGLTAIGLFEFLLGTLRSYIFSHTTSRIDVELGARLFHHLLSLPIGYFESRQAGQTVARVRELETIRNFITGSALTLVLDLLFSVIFIAVMFYYSVTLTLIVLASIPFYVTLSILVTPVLRRRIEEKFQRGAANQALLVETVTGVETVKAMAIEPHLRRRWEDQLAAYVKASFRSATLGQIASQAVMLINKLTTALVLWIGAGLVIDNQLSIGMLIAFNMLAGQVNGPVLRLAQLWQDFQQMRLSVARLGDIFDSPIERGRSVAQARLPRPRGEICFDHVRFRYRPDGREVLTDLTLTIPAGQVIGIVGRSGSGKSTLTKLVQRLYTPERGRVLIDGTDIAMMDPAWLRRNIGVVLQDNVLFNRSVRDNIALADPAMPMERIITAAKLAGAHEFILELAQGYDTELGERGANLSGGQRQRIAIARALATDPSILIFDEATSALDYESEKHIQDHMREICRGKTVLIIAHRLSTVRFCDRLISLEKGRLIEDGTHETLLCGNGPYATLFRQQLY